MSINKSGFSSMVYKHLRKPVLIAGVLIGGASMFAGAAQANLYRSTCNFTSLQTECTGPSGIGWVTTPVGAPGNPPLQLGDKLLNIVNYSFDDWSTGSLTKASGHFDFSWNDVDNNPGGYLDDYWTVNTTFDNPVTGDGANVATGTLNYTLSILGGNTFKDVELDSNHQGAGGVVNKYINDPAFPMGNPASPAGSPLLVSINGAAVGPLPLGGTSVNVTDTYSVSNAGSLDSFDNTFTQTPAPLPILGVGAAFGSIRKLRKFSSRLKTFSMG